MDNSTPIFLTPIELPEYCFLSEAVEWIGLGKPFRKFHIEQARQFKNTLARAKNPNTPTQAS